MARMHYDSGFSGMHIEVGLFFSPSKIPALFSKLVITTTVYTLYIQILLISLVFLRTSVEVMLT